MDIDDVLANASPQERTVRLLLNGKLRARWDQLAHDLDEASPKAASLGDVAPATRIAREMEDLREQIRAAEVPFRMVASEPRAWSRFMDTKPDPEGMSDDERSEAWHRWLCAMVAVACVDPVMTVEQVEQLCSKLSNSQWLDLSNAAWDLNSEREQVPFSDAASALTMSGGGRSKQPGPSASPSPDSSAGNPPKQPRTSATSKAA